MEFSQIYTNSLLIILCINGIFTNLYKFTIDSFVYQQKYICTSSPLKILYINRNFTNFTCSPLRTLYINRNFTNLYKFTIENVQKFHKFVHVCVCVCSFYILTEISQIFTFTIENFTCHDIKEVTCGTTFIHKVCTLMLITYYILSDKFMLFKLPCKIIC